MTILFKDTELNTELSLTRINNLWSSQVEDSPTKWSSQLGERVGEGRKRRWGGEGRHFRALPGPLSSLGLHCLLLTVVWNVSKRSDLFLGNIFFKRRILLFFFDLQHISSLRILHWLGNARCTYREQVKL